MPIVYLGDLQLHYQRRGQGPPLLGIMGFGLDQRFWASLIPVVTETHEFITFDNRGVGRSRGAGSAGPQDKRGAGSAGPQDKRGAGSAGPQDKSGSSQVTTIEDMADDTHRLLDALEIESCVVFGISMGGAIAQHLALEHPERVSALVLGVTWARPIEFMRRQHVLARALIKAGGSEMLVESSLVRMFTPMFFEMGAEVLDQMIKAFMAERGPDVPTSEVLLAQMDAIDKHDVLDRLGEIDVPTLVLGARNDMMVPYLGSQEIAGAIPGAELVTFETGHGCMIEEMPAFNEALKTFLAKL